MRDELAIQIRGDLAELALVNAKVTDLLQRHGTGAEVVYRLGEQVKTGQLRSLQNRPVEGRRRTLCNGSTRRNKRARIGDLSNTLSIPFALSPAVRGQLRPPGFTGAGAPAASR